MNILSIPYHDWRKIEREGSRTRDAHFIKHFASNPIIDKMVVINRPTSYLEIFLLKKKFPIKGEVILKDKGYKLIKVDEKLYVIDYISFGLEQMLKRKRWFFESFGHPKFLDFCDKCLKYLDINEYKLISHNIFSINFKTKTKSSTSIFDAYDNQVFFPHNNSIKEKLIEAYKEFKNAADIWITNSIENINYYKKNYQIDKCILVKNGVDFDLFLKDYSMPKDLENIPRPIIGFGGKISHIVDYQTINYIAKEHPDKSFVLVGQLLDKQVFKGINKRPNIFYLGDKNYQDYPSYVKNFDIGIVPYVSSKLQHGGDSMKVYEYLAAGLNVVGVPAGGMQDLSSYIYLANSPKEFSNYISEALNSTKKKKIPEEYSWSYKANEIIKLLNKEDSI